MMVCSKVIADFAIHACIIQQTTRGVADTLGQSSLDLHSRSRDNIVKMSYQEEGTCEHALVEACSTMKLRQKKSCLFFASICLLRRPGAVLFGFGTTSLLL
jgi:hypothetical protein